jgi:hypothetical protein
VRPDRVVVASPALDDDFDFAESVELAAQSRQSSLLER